MEDHTKDTSSDSAVRQTGGEPMIEKEQNDSERTYWGIICRTCAEKVVFDIFPCLSFGPDAVSAKPGAIRCSRDHNHIYFYRDFRFFDSAILIDVAVMEANRKIYRAINPSYRCPSHPLREEPNREKPFPAAVLHIPSRGNLHIGVLGAGRQMVEMVAEVPCIERALKTAM